eukprot:m.273528 g.273528  ORF g.273528 m.273528 type:complete len:542 (+) comp40578_c0_seq7:67-1692(+)
MAEKELEEVAGLSKVSSDVGDGGSTKTDLRLQQALLASELQQLVQGQAERVAEHIQKGADVNHRYCPPGDSEAGDSIDGLDLQGLTPFDILLMSFKKESNGRDSRAVCLETLEILVKNGAKPSLCNSNVGLRHLSVLAETEVVVMSSNPVERALCLSYVCSKLAPKGFGESKETLKELSQDMQKLAIEIARLATEEAGPQGVDLDVSIKFAVNKERKLFIASPPIQNELRSKWGESRGLPFAVLFYLFYSLFHPFLQRCLSRKSAVVKNELSGIYFANAFMYVVFILLVSFNVSQKANRDTIEESLSSLDWVILVFVMAIFWQEVTRLLNYSPNCDEYFKQWSNIFDMLLIAIFTVYFALRGAGFVENEYNILRASFHVLGWASLIACIRLLFFCQAIPKLSAILSSFAGIVSDMILFLVILGTFQLGFGLALASVYSVGPKNPGSNSTSAGSNSTLPSSPNPPYGSGVWASLKTLFWALFGLIDVDNFDVGKSAETAMGQIFLAFWLGSAVIVLLNMLIALISNAFQRVQVKNNLDMLRA